MTDNIKLPPHSIPEVLTSARKYAEAYAREAVRLNATVPDAPTWEKVQKAWYAVGADVAGLDWSAFVRKVSAAPAAPQPVQAVPDGDAAEAVHDTNAVLASRYFELLKVVEAYEKHGVTCQTFRHFVDTPCAECNCAPAAPQPAQQQQAVPDGFVPQTCPHCNETWLMEAQQPLTDEHKAILKECRNQAMKWTADARIPEAGAFGGIAQDLDYLCAQLGVKND